MLRLGHGTLVEALLGTTTAIEVSSRSFSTKHAGILAGPKIYSQTQRSKNVNAITNNKNKTNNNIRKLLRLIKNSRASNNIIQNINIEITNLLLIIMRGRSARRAACPTLVSMLSFGSSVQGLYFRGLRSRVWG